MNKLHLIKLQHHRRLLSMIWIWVPPLTVTHLASDLESLCRNCPPLRTTMRGTILPSSLSR